MKNPYECDDVDELREIAFCYIQRCKIFQEERQVFIDILLENNINPSLREIIARINRKRMISENDV